MKNYRTTSFPNSGTIIVHFHWAATTCTRVDGVEKVEKVLTWDHTTVKRFNVRQALSGILVKTLTLQFFTLLKDNV